MKLWETAKFLATLMKYLDRFIPLRRRRKKVEESLTLNKSINYYYYDIFLQNLFSESCKYVEV